MGSCCSTDDVSSSPLFHDLEDPYDYCHHCCKQTSRLHNVVHNTHPMLVCEACKQSLFTSA